MEFVKKNRRSENCAVLKKRVSNIVFTVVLISGFLIFSVFLFLCDSNFLSVFGTQIANGNKCI